jgi:hypothetical protein
VTTTPLAFLLSLIGVIRGEDRLAAIVGMVISGIAGGFLLGLPLLTFLAGCLQ